MMNRLILLLASAPAALSADSLTQNSDFNVKTGISQVDEMYILGKVAALPVMQWEYIDAPGEHQKPIIRLF